MKRQKYRIGPDAYGRVVLDGEPLEDLDALEVLVDWTADGRKHLLGDGELDDADNTNRTWIPALFRARSDVIQVQISLQGRSCHAEDAPDDTTGRFGEAVVLVVSGRALLELHARRPAPAQVTP